jgi:hypothetical protein
LFKTGQLYTRYYKTKACQVIPNQNIKIINPLKTVNSLEDKSAGKIFNNCIEEPNKTFIQLLKKNVGPNKYKRTIRNKQSRGKRSKKKLKNRISETNIIDPGKPKKTKQLTRLIKNNLGHKKFIPLISVINRVLKRLPIASTSKKELVDNKAWLINIQKLANIKAD